MWRSRVFVVAVDQRQLSGRFEDFWQRRSGKLAA
jgi:hypothetical protein